MAKSVVDLVTAIKNYVDTGLGGKQATLAFDTTPTASSTNPVTSGGVKTALDAKATVTSGTTDIGEGAALATGSIYVVMEA